MVAGAVTVPFSVLCAGRLCLLALRLGNAALDAKGGAIGAGNAERGSVAPYLYS